MSSSKRRRVDSQVVHLPQYDVLNMQGVRHPEFPEPAAGVNSVSPEWHMSPTGDSSTNFLFAVRLAGANGKLLAAFVTATPSKGDWTLSKYMSFLRGKDFEDFQQQEVDREIELLQDTQNLESQADGILADAVKAFAADNDGMEPTYGDILAIDVPANANEKFPSSWTTIISALGPDCGCRSKRPFVPAFRTEVCRNIEMVTDDSYRYTHPNENPVRPMFTNASKSALFAVFFRMLMKARSLHLPALVTPQIGLSVFNHDAVVAQDMLALAMKSYQALAAMYPPEHPLILYVATVDSPDKVDTISKCLNSAMEKWDAATLQEAAVEIMGFLPGLRQIPKPHVRSKAAAGDTAVVFPYLLAEPGAFPYNSPQANAVLNEGAVASWEALSAFLYSEDFLHFDPEPHGKFSFWLVPAVATSMWRKSVEVIERLAMRFGMHTFPPHVTLCPSFKASRREAVARGEAVAKAIRSCHSAGSSGQVPARISGEVTVAPMKFFRALVLELSVDDCIEGATKAARQVLFPEDDPRRTQAYAPHLSLLYGTHSPEALEQAKEGIVGELDSFGRDCTGVELVLVMTTGEEYWKWPEVARYNLCVEPPASL